MSGLLEYLDNLENSITNAENLESSILSERKAYLASMQHRLDQLRVAQAEADKDLRRAVDDKLFVETEYLQPAEKRKLLRIMSKLTLAESQKISEEWRVFVGKFVCSEDVNENWNSIKRALQHLQSNK